MAGARQPETTRTHPSSLSQGAAREEPVETSLQRSSRWLVANQVGIAFNILALLFVTHAFFREAQPYTSKFFKLSYYNVNTGHYAAGYSDFCFISFCVVLLSGLRAGCMEYVLSPLARRWGLTNTKTVTRFTEQAWMLSYYSIFGPLGMYIYYHAPYFLNQEELWTNWPQRELDGLNKAYFLAQWAFWIQQVLVIHIEKRRKDHWQMLSHHLVTIALIAASYSYHYSRVGHQIMVLMDAIDLVFPLAKCFKYFGYETVCNVLFVVFIIVWFLSRHVLYLLTCWSLYSDIPRVMTVGCYKGSMDNLQGPFPIPDNWSYLLEPFRDPEGLVCYTNGIINGFLSYLLILQGMMVMWSVLVVQVAARTIKGEDADDIRSDDEDEGLDQDEQGPEYDDFKPIEEDVGVESINLRGWEQRSGHRVATTTATGVRMPGQSERLELMKRIGCDKQIE